MTTCTMSHQLLSYLSIKQVTSTEVLTRGHYTCTCFLSIASRWRPLYHKQRFWKLGELSTDTDNDNTNNTNDKWGSYRLIFGIAKWAKNVNSTIHFSTSEYSDVLLLSSNGFGEFLLSACSRAALDDVHVRSNNMLYVGGLLVICNINRSKRAVIFKLRGKSFTYYFYGEIVIF